MSVLDHKHLHSNYRVKVYTFIHISRRQKLSVYIYLENIPTLTV